MAATPQTYAEFIVSYKTFSQLPEALVQAKLDEAEEMLNPEHWNELFSQAVSTMAAHLLSIHPFGTQVQLEPNNGETVYLKHYKEVLLPMLGARMMVP